MKYSLLAAAALSLLTVAVSSQAQHRCIPVYDCPEGYEELDYFRGDLGWHVIWFYQKLGTDGKPVVYADGISCKHGICNPGSFASYLNDIRAQAGLDMVKAATLVQKDLASLGSLDCAVADKPLCDERASIVATRKVFAEGMFALKAVPLGGPPGTPGVPVPPPPPASAPGPVVVIPVYTYHVKPNTAAADLSRPVYLFDAVAKKRGTSIIGRATANQPCKDPVLPSDSSLTDSWAEFGPDFKDHYITLCAKN